MSAIVHSDERCGTLHCDISAVTGSLPVDFRDLWAISGSWTWNYGDGTLAFRCQIAEYLTFYSGPDRPNPGLVPDGASCGTGSTPKVTVSTTRDLSIDKFMFRFFCSYKLS